MFFTARLYATRLPQTAAWSVKELLGGGQASEVRVEALAKLATLDHAELQQEQVRRLAAFLQRVKDADTEGVEPLRTLTPSIRLHELDNVTQPEGDDVLSHASHTHGSFLVGKY
jgi:Asp-tRNA(Asn)/Glu-tRNA(Gln) amidotransferase C subunit